MVKKKSENKTKVQKIEYNYTHTHTHHHYDLWKVLTYFFVFVIAITLIGAIAGITEKTIEMKMQPTSSHIEAYCYFNAIELGNIYNSTTEDVTCEFVIEGSAPAYLTQKLTRGIR